MAVVSAALDMRTSAVGQATARARWDWRLHRASAVGSESRDAALTLGLNARSPYCRVIARSSDCGLPEPLQVLQPPEVDWRLARDSCWDLVAMIRPERRRNATLRVTNCESWGQTRTKARLLKLLVLQEMQHVQASFAVQSGASLKDAESIESFRICCWINSRSGGWTFNW